MTPRMEKPSISKLTPNPRTPQAGTPLVPALACQAVLIPASLSPNARASQTVLAAAHQLCSDHRLSPLRDTTAPCPPVPGDVPVPAPHSAV